MRSASATTSPSGWRRRCGRAACIAPCCSPRSCAPGRCGSTTIARPASPPRSAATRTPVSAASPGPRRSRSTCTRSRCGSRPTSTCRTRSCGARAMTQALSGIRVLDLSNVLAGPLCAYQLALLGAEVIKVEVPKSGDLARQLGADPGLNARHMGASFLAQNSGKKSITVNLKSDAGKEVLRRLARSADVLVENFRPGVMDRLGLGYRELRELNSSLVYCAISGFGQNGPMKDAPAYDQIIQGLSGMMSVTGSEDTGPMRAGYPVADTVGGITAAFAIAAALVRRSRTGEGSLIDVSMLDSAIVSLGWVVSNYLIADVIPRAIGNENFTAAPSGTFRTGRGLLNIAANKQEQFEALAQALGREDLVADPRFAEREG